MIYSSNLIRNSFYCHRLYWISILWLIHFLSINFIFSPLPILLYFWISLVFFEHTNNFYGSTYWFHFLILSDIKCINLGIYFLNYHIPFLVYINQPDAEIISHHIPHWVILPHCYLKKHTNSHFFVFSYWLCTFLNLVLNSIAWNHRTLN